MYVFRGDGRSLNIGEMAGQLNDLKKEVEQLERDEERLDSDRVIVDDYIKQITKDLANQK